jgi:hypothetical protein
MGHGFPWDAVGRPGFVLRWAGVVAAPWELAVDDGGAGVGLTALLDPGAVGDALPAPEGTGVPTWATTAVGAAAPWLSVVVVGRAPGDDGLGSVCPFEWAGSPLGRATGPFRPGIGTPPSTLIAKTSTPNTRRPATAENAIRAARRRVPESSTKTDVRSRCLLNRGPPDPRAPNGHPRLSTPPIVTDRGIG